MVKRRSKKKKSRSRTKGVSVIGLAETYMLANVATQTLFRTNPMQFLMGTNAQFQAEGKSSISLKELFKSNQSSGAEYYNTGEVIKRNLTSQWFNGAFQMVLIPLGFKLGKNLAKPAISRTNRLLGKSGIGNTVKL